MMQTLWFDVSALAVVGYFVVAGTERILRRRVR